MNTVSLLVLDFDGVLTDNHVQVHQSGEESVSCHRGDGWGIARLKEAGFDVVVLSTETNAVVTARCRKLSIEAVQGRADKLAALQQLASERELKPHQVAYVGNDLNDLACMQWAGWPIAVADAVPEIRALAKWVTHLPGGQGAVREVADRLLLAADEKDPSLDWARKSIWRSIEINRTIADSNELLTHIMTAARALSAVLAAGSRVFLFSDGPAAATAQYLSSVIGQLVRQRGAVPLIVLLADNQPHRRTPNEHADDLVLQLSAQARAGDLAVGVTVTGDSPRVLHALDTARHAGLHTLALTGASGGQMFAVSDVCIAVPSYETQTIHDAHILIGRVLAGHVAHELLHDRPDEP
jgi:YrbI family 3-deoxy-D-manno-octulosonate 8-phosphate phosphatase